MKLEVKQLENGDWILYLLDENGQKIKARITTTTERIMQAGQNARDLDRGYKVYKYHLKEWTKLLLASMATAGVVTSPLWLEDMLEYIEGDDPQEGVKSKE